MKRCPTHTENHTEGNKHIFFVDCLSSTHIRGDNGLYFDNLVFIQFLADIQECYEVTLQLNTTQNAVKEASAEDAGEVRNFQKVLLHFRSQLVHNVKICKPDFF